MGSFADFETEDCEIDVSFNGTVYEPVIPDILTSYSGSMVVIPINFDIITLGE